MSEIIYDIGANKGGNLPYYLKKSNRIIAVEANPKLIASIERKYKAEIERGQLVVVNCVITTSNFTEKTVPFYIHKINSVLSQLPEPAQDKIAQFTKVDLPRISVIELINKYGTPDYLKIDIEHYDHILLKCLFENNIFPNRISAEAHTEEVLNLLTNNGGYKSFKLIEGLEISRKYRNSLISTDEGLQPFRFLLHSAGPYGQDINGEWFDKYHLRKVLTCRGFGWRDIHASKVDDPTPLKFSFIKEQIKRAAIILNVSHLLGLWLKRCFKRALKKLSKHS